MISAVARETLSFEGDLNEETRLFGGSSEFDSIAVVSLLAEIEQRINDRCGTSIIIADERAMSQKRSPFRSIGTLAEYIQQLVSEQQGLAS
jgi:acyl carrier protein